MQKLNKDLGWKPSVTFEEGLGKTIDWYLENKEWLENVTNYQNTTKTIQEIIQKIIIRKTVSLNQYKHKRKIKT
jgi:dTDP-D-glucose 4,6-dehydratase